MNRSTSETPRPKLARTPEELDLLEKTSKWLNEGNLRVALEALGRSKKGSAWIQNARGVCHLRLGETGRAVEIFRSLVLATTQNLRDDIPTVFKTNYASALLADGNLGGFEFVLNEIRDDPHPLAANLRDAYRRYLGTLSIWQKIKWTLGSIPPKLDILHPPLGDLGSLLDFESA